MANVIEELQRPTLVLAHNKTLAAQLYSEFKQFFPKNAVEYFVSYYDYYQPEAYIPSSGLYIEKDLSINEEIEKLRLSTTSSLLSGRRDVLVVASVSCLYGIGNPVEFQKMLLLLKKERSSREPNSCTDWFKAFTRVQQVSLTEEILGSTVISLTSFPAMQMWPLKSIFLAMRSKKLNLLTP